jgi:3',5'-cyclic AMP phosphodiesterase CpdA
MRKFHSGTTPNRLAVTIIAAAFLALSTHATAQDPAPAPAPDPAPAPARPQLRFAQITDAHLFDAGYKCSGQYVEREYQENLAALQWSFAEITRRWNSGDHIDFLVFTGDLGIANLVGGPTGHPKPDASSKCANPDDPAGTYGPIKQMDFAAAEAILARLIKTLPSAMPVYFLPGNNDLGTAASSDEDPTTLWRYDQFIAGLKTLAPNRVVDLTGQSIKQPSGYTLIGLNSSGFKPQSYDDDGNAMDESALAKKGAASAAGQSFCEDLGDNGAGSRASKKADSIQKTVSLITSGQARDSGPFLVFTHEPDLQDPFRNTNKSNSCDYRSTWLLPAGARAAWNSSVLNNNAVLAIFAGHFHADNPAKYGGPLVNDSIASSLSVTRTGGITPTFVTPPLAVKLQWTNYPVGARGMSFVTVTGNQVVEQIDPYWPPSASYGSTTPAWSLAIQAFFARNPSMAFVAAFFLTLILVGIVLGLAGNLNPPADLTPDQAAARRNESWIHKLAKWPARALARTWNLATSLLVEADTQSYSLSKMQFLLWTLTTIYGYTYLYIAHTWVQGLPGIPDIQNQFPWEVALSAGTTLVSQASNRVLGGKGSGPLRPHLSDLISAGGTMAPGRLQFFSWTLVGIAAYLSSVFATDPNIVNGLPTIPPELLTVSGISSLAYLGSRAVSGPGPVLSSAAFEPGTPGPAVPMAPPPPTPPNSDDSGNGGDAGTGTGTATPASAPVAAAIIPVASSPGMLVLVGRYLSRNAALSLKPQTTSDSDSAADSSALPANAAFTYEAPPQSPADKDLEPGNPGFYTRLTLQVTGVELGKTYTLRLTNPDGKYAEIALAVTPQQSGR